MGKFSEALSDELSLFVRQTAWLHARPKPEAKSRALANREKKDENPPSRLERMQRDGIQPPMPPLSLPWMVDLLMEIGPTEQGAMAACAIGWRTLDAWCNRTGVDLTPGDCRLLRRLSGEYLMEGDRAREPDCPSPWATRRVEQNREAVSAKLASVFERMMRPKPKG
jgi:hypothetical protein